MRLVLTACALSTLAFACAAPASEDAASSEEHQTAVQLPDLAITFVGCTPDFAGQGRASGTLPHDGIDACSEDDGSYNLGGYHLDLLRDGSGTDRELTERTSTWREDGGDVTLTIPGTSRAREARLKAWFGGHASSITLGALPAGDALRCEVRLVGRWSAEVGAYAKHAQLDCAAKGASSASGTKTTAGACEVSAECGAGQVCGVTYACIDGCLGGALPGAESMSREQIKDEREACAKACPTVCRPATLDI